MLVIGTEYASASLFSSSTVSMAHQPHSSPLVNKNHFCGGGIPVSSSTCGTLLSHFSADQQMSTTSGSSAYQSRLTPSGENIAPSFGPYHLYHPVGSILIPSGHSSNPAFQANFPLQVPPSFIGEHNLGMLPGAQSMPQHFFSQALLRSEPMVG